jgi:hypothetical protein
LTQLNRQILANLTMESYGRATSDCLGCHAASTTHDGKPSDVQWSLFDEAADKPVIEVLEDETFGRIYTNIVASGYRYHSGPTHYTGFAFNGDEQTAHDVLVNQTSSEDATTDLVTPGDAANSYGFRKLEGTQSSGSRMPFGGPYLDQPHLDAIRGWTEAGPAP